MSYHHKGPRTYHGSMGDDVLDLFYETDQSEKVDGDPLYSRYSQFCSFQVGESSYFA